MCNNIQLAVDVVATDKMKILTWDKRSTFATHTHNGEDMTEINFSDGTEVDKNMLFQSLHCMLKTTLYKQ